MRLLDHLQSALPKYKTTIPSTGKETFFRPFLVKEEKILLMAKDNDDDSTVLNAIANIVESCVDGVNNAYKIPMVDLEYLFCQIRAKSVSETAEPIFTCPVTDESVKVGINLTDLDIHKSDVKNVVKINDEMTIRMKSPTVYDYMNIDSKNATDSLISKCIDTITLNEEVFDGSDISDDEKTEFIENLTHTQYNNLCNFITEQPYVYKVIEYRTKDGVERKLRLEGMLDFFG